MTDPLALLPLALAVRGGRVDAFEAQQLVAAGITLLARSAPLVRALSGRRSAILLPTSPAFLVALAASEGRGAVLVNPLAAPAEIEHQLADANVGAVFTSGALASRLPETVTRVLLDDAPRTARVVAADGTARDVDLGSHFGFDIAGEEDAPGRDEEAAVVYTSAMSGTALGAILTHRNLISNARATVEAGGLGADEHALALLPFSHMFGLVVSGAAPLLAGGRVTTMERFNPLRAVDTLEREGVTLLVAVPAVFLGLLAAMERRGSGLARGALRTCICGGAPLSPEAQDRWFDATGVELRQGYGLTEAGPVCLFNRVDLPNRRGTLGVPFPGVRVSVRSHASGDECADGVDGEICVAGENVSPGYIGEPAATAEDPWAGGLPRRDGWLRTGDLGVRHADGTIAFRGLIKPMFTRNGFNVYPREIERVVGAMPGVTSVRVRPIPDPAKEHEILLEVAGDVSADDVKRWCEPRLAAYKQASRVEIVEAPPTSGIPAL